ncbi:MAG: Do family serine endopeptidase [Hyphomicrobiales bacterium]
MSAQISAAFGKKFSYLIPLLAAFALLISTSGQSVRAHNGPDSIADLAETLLDAVVNISTATNVGGEARRNRGPQRPEAPDGSPFEEFFDEFFERQERGQGRQRRVQSLGSGFVIDSSGIIITNNHVIEGADEITINFANGDALIAELVGTDKKTDLAVLKVKSDKPLPFVNFGSSEKMRVGDWVMAIGNPFGLSSSLSAGIVSAINRDINSGPYDNFIQTDAAINKGNSGGPLFNEKGEVIGINTAIFSPSGGGSVGVGFSVPSDTAVAVISQLREFGETRRGWLGVRIQQVTEDIAVGLELGEPRGALVAGVTATGPAEAAGIAAGDVVVTFDGRPVKEMKDLPRMVADTPVGEAVDVEVFRKGKTLKFKVDLGRLEEGEKLANNDSTRSGTEKEKPNSDDPTVILGMTVTELTEELREKYKVADSIKGLVITHVETDSKAAEKGVLVGEVIMEVGQSIVETRDAIVARLEALKQEDRKSVLFLMSGIDGELRFVAIKTE